MLKGFRQSIYFHTTNHTTAEVADIIAPLLKKWFKSDFEAFEVNEFKNSFKYIIPDTNPYCWILIKRNSAYLKGDSDIHLYNHEFAYIDDENLLAKEEYYLKRCTEVLQLMWENEMITYFDNDDLPFKEENSNL